MNRKERRAMMKEMRFNRIEGKLSLLWLVHFGHAGKQPFEGATCEDCMDYKLEACKGGQVPEDCMYEKAKTAKIEVGFGD